MAEHTFESALLRELFWRGLIAQTTNDQGLDEHLAQPRRVYCGFDPTADSLTIGNLVPIMLLAHARRAGHTPVVVMGGGTGMIGDPSGKSAERTLMTEATILHHIDCQRPIFDRVFANAAETRGGEKLAGLPVPMVLNNMDWLGGISYLEALRDIGKHFSVNMMMQKDSVKARLESREQGISYTEFSYMILQSYDFAHLHAEQSVTVQLGGSDQFGNIVAGIDLIRKRRLPIIERTLRGSLAAHERAMKAKGVEQPTEKAIQDFVSKLAQSSEDVVAGVAQQSKQFMEDLAKSLVSKASWQDSVEFVEAVWRDINRLGPTFGLTAPLVTKADGGKFGKTEEGAIWLTPERTSPYAYFQFWLNASDADAANWIKVFTFLHESDVESLLAEHEANPAARVLQKRLAAEATAILHGADEAAKAEAAGRALFSGDLAGLDERTMRDVFANVPSSEHARALLADAGLGLVDFLIEVGLAKSKRESREFLANGSVSVNGAKVDADRAIGEGDLLHGSMIALRRGKKAWHMTRWA